jgi:hypothetical protein
LRKERDVLATPKQGEVESTLFLQSVPYPFNRCSLQKHGRVVNPPLQHEGQVVNLPILFTSPCPLTRTSSPAKERVRVRLLHQHHLACFHKTARLQSVEIHST